MTSDIARFSDWCIAIGPNKSISDIILGYCFLVQNVGECKSRKLINIRIIQTDQIKITVAITNKISGIDK